MAEMKPLDFGTAAATWPSPCLILSHVGARLLDHGGRRAAACSVERTSCSSDPLGQEPPHCRYGVPSARSSWRSRAGHSLPASMKLPGRTSAGLARCSCAGWPPRSAGARCPRPARRSGSGTPSRFGTSTRRPRPPFFRLSSGRDCARSRSACRRGRPRGVEGTLAEWEPRAANCS